MVQLGMPVPEVLAAATSAAAEACRLGDRTGRLRAGLQADLLLVDGDATRDITALKSVHQVIYNGVAVRA
jgi:imidazolonepropionase-like amidohydrolase